MKTFFSPVILHFVLTLVALACLAAVGRASDPTPMLDIAVRSSVDKPFGGFKHKPPPEHGKKYYLAGAKQIENGKRLVRPVNTVAMLADLKSALHKRGFTEVVGDENPDVVLVVKYGRGFLQNPYLADASFNSGDDPPSSTITGAWAVQLVKEHSPGFETKLQKANFEKLYILIAAYQYPKPANGKAKELWETTMIVDDPESRDLNLSYKKMFDAGSAYFDKPLADEEVEINTSVPEGRVDIGNATVVKPEAKEK